MLQAGLVWHYSVTERQLQAGLVGTDRFFDRCDWSCAIYRRPPAYAACFSRLASARGRNPFQPRTWFQLQQSERVSVQRRARENLDITEYCDCQTLDRTLVGIGDRDLGRAALGDEKHGIARDYAHGHTSLSSTRPPAAGGTEINLPAPAAHRRPHEISQRRGIRGAVRCQPVIETIALPGHPTAARGEHILPRPASYRVLP